LTALRAEAPRLIAELVGTFALVFVGCGAIMVDAEGGDLGQIGISLAFGLVIAAMIAAVGPVSGAHFNPAVTLSLWALRELPGRRVPGYWLAQVAGAVAAAALLRASLGDVAEIGATQPSESDGQAFVWEVALTFILLAVIAAVACGGRLVPPVTAGVAVGGTIAMASLVGGPISGASLNPARSLGPALVSGELDALWIYLTAPFVGGILGAALVVALYRSTPAE
jgi:MIP family channel proteins